MSPQLDPGYNIKQALLQLAEAQTRAAEAATRSFNAVAELASAHAHYVKVAEEDRVLLRDYENLINRSFDKLIRLMTAEHQNAAKPKTIAKAGRKP